MSNILSPLRKAKEFVTMDKLYQHDRHDAIAKFATEQGLTYVVLTEHEAVYYRGFGYKVLSIDNMLGAKGPFLFDNAVIVDILKGIASYGPKDIQSAYDLGVSTGALSTIPKVETPVDNVKYFTFIGLSVGAAFLMAMFVIALVRWL